MGDAVALRLEHELGQLDFTLTNAQHADLVAYIEADQSLESRL